MKKKIILDDGIVCEMRRYRRSKCLRIIVRGDGSVLLTLPFFVSYRVGEVFLRSKEEWIKKHRVVFSKRSENILLQGGQEEYKKYFARAYELINERLEYFGRKYGVKWGNVTIRNQKTRWGSCSRKGNLSFHYRLLFLPAHLRDYVVVHELCHLREFNHSPKFWALVAETFPDYPKLRHELHLL